MKLQHKYLFYFVSPFFCLLFLGCKARIPEPETTDPLYLDLRRLEANSLKESEDASKAVAEATKTLQNLPPNSPDLAVSKNDVSKAIQKRDHAEQAQRYYAIRAEKRKFEDRVSYEAAFEHGEIWPPPTEYHDYLENQKLRSVNLEWQSRVPSLVSRYSKNPPSLSKKVSSQKPESAE